MSALMQRAGMATWSRAELVAATFFLALANGMVNRVVYYANDFGLSAGIFSLFGISALVFICLYLSFVNLSRGGWRTGGSL